MISGMLDRAAQRWDELSALHEKATALPEHERIAFVNKACGEDSELRELLFEVLGISGDVEERLRDAIGEVASDPLTSPSLIGTTVGAYHIESELGRGGMGEVFLASRADGEFEKRVAVKVVRGSWSGDAVAALFRTERQVLANLNHPAIPSLVDSGLLEDGRSYFICDYIEGIGLDAYSETTTLSLNQKLDLLSAIGSAVQHAHNNLVLHLDIKPANILIQPNGRPSLLDFGVARLMGELNDDHRAFSPGYASPEQIAGEAVTAASDVYSLGALLFFLLAGRGPFALESQTPTETILLKQTEFLRTLRDAGDQSAVDSDLRAIVRKAMAHTSGERYPTVHALLRDIERFRQHYPIDARKHSIGGRMLKFVRRNRLPAAIAASVALAIAGFVLREYELRRAAQAAERSAAKVSDFLAGVFHVMDPNQSRGGTVTARELLDGAVQRIPAELGGQPDVAARVLHALSDTYAGLGLYDEATAMMEDALGLGDEGGSAVFTRDREAQLLNALGRQYANAGRLEDALSLMQDNVSAVERDLGPDSEPFIHALSTIASVYTMLERFDEAKGLHEEAVARAEEVFGRESPQLTRVLYDQDLFLQMTGDMAPREPLLQRIVAIEAGAFGADHLRVARAVSRLAMYYVEDLRPELAVAAHERASALALAALGPKHPELAMYQQRLGVTHRNMGAFDEAERYILQALSIREQALGPMHPSVGTTASVLGSLYNSMGRRTEALTYLHRALDIMRTYHPDNHSRVGYQKMALGEVYRVTGDLERAEHYTVEAVETLRAIDTRVDFALDGEWQLANIYRDQGRFEEALPVYERLFAWHHANPSLDEAHMLEVTEDFRALLLLMDDHDRAAKITVPGSAKTTLTNRR
jgi:serine/threonine-protein kinase